MQQSRAVVLTGAAHERLWDVVTEAWNKGVEEEGKYSSVISLAIHDLPSWRRGDHEAARRDGATDEIEKRNGFKGQVDHAFRPGYGSILFFEDQAVLDEFSGKMPAYSAVRLSRASSHPPFSSYFHGMFTARHSIPMLYEFPLYALEVSADLDSPSTAHGPKTLPASCNTSSGPRSKPRATVLLSRYVSVSVFVSVSVSVLGAEEGIRANVSLCSSTLAVSAPQSTKPSSMPSSCRRHGRGYVSFSFRPLGSLITDHCSLPQIRRLCTRLWSSNTPPCGVHHEYEQC